MVPREIDVPSAFLPPSWHASLRHRRAGSRRLSRVILGARYALIVSVLVVGIAVLVGVPLGAIAGYRRAARMLLMMRTTDLFLQPPRALLLAMAITAALGPGLEHAALALAIAWWPWYTRIARATAVSLREQPFIDAARAIGVRDSSVVMRHIIPNSLGPIVVQATVDVGTVILAAGSLAFIGLGARPPTPDWADGGAGPDLHPRPVVDRQLPGPGHLHRRAGLQRARRPAAAAARPEAAMTTVSPASAALPLHDLGDSLLRIRDLRLAFVRDDGSATVALHGIDLDVAAGEALGVVGETGCGKTVTRPGRDAAAARERTRQRRADDVRRP